MTTSHSDSDNRSTGKLSDDHSPQEKLKVDAQGVKREVSARAHEQAEAGQQRLAEEADALSDAIDAAAQNLDDQDREGLARYARQLSMQMADAAGQLEARSVDELASDAKRLARHNPALFMLGSIAVGFGLSRFFKASAERDHHDGDTADQEGDAFRDADFSSSLNPSSMASTASNSGNGRKMP